ncbi:MAG: cytochrome c oxidase subunit II [Chloroflexi bacterium]|nr:cytochrome c oxidase subunit II [Chloroflexota bacterium]
MSHQNGRRYLSLLLFLFPLLALLLACTPSHPQSTFDALGDVAQKQLLLFRVIFWAAVFVFVVVEAILLYSVIRFRRRPNQAHPVPIHGNSRLEWAWTLAPAIVLAVIAVPTVRYVFETGNVPENEALRIKVIGHQWWWEFRYPQEYGNVVTANELRIPVGQVVVLTLESKDVIHSFWIPKLAGKVDLIPNRTNIMWIRAESEGEFYGQCAEFCGIAHAKMRFRVKAEASESFEAWVKAMKAPPPPPGSDAEAEGARLFTQKGCIACHKIEGTAAVGILGPNLTLFASRSTVGAGILDNTEYNVARWLRDPDEVKRGNLMAALAPFYRDPTMRLKEGEIEALVAYLHSLQ